MVCGVVEIAAGVGLVWVRRDGVGTVVAVSVAAVVPGVAAVGFAVLAVVVPSALSVLTALMSVHVGGCCGAVLYGICCRICVGAVFSLACVAVRGVGLCLLLGCCLRLDGFRDGCHGHRRADHGRARDRAEQVVKGSFHSGASR